MENDKSISYMRLNKCFRFYYYCAIEVLTASDTSHSFVMYALRRRKPPVVRGEISQFCFAFSNFTLI